ncbi:dentin sialophosphoprotein-like [Nilaparvata lugens]|uniref:dentin sialophosphoprotein-like n=1 Tax=Nilaparvata lugens TaxID=108931 RepID=UPI00193CF86A|nr:dentin sialophosphoprotein-like [Nilaparvata lugens]
MDKFLKPDKFDGDPNSPTALQEWNFWLKTFENFIASFDEEDIDDENVDSETHRKTYIRDSFIRGLSSHQIRLRLLEFDKLTLDEAIEKARALESARNQSAGAVGDCESVIGGRKKEKKKKRGEVESATDCESTTIVSEKEREKENEEGGEGSVYYDSGLSVSSVGEKKKKKKKEKREGFGCSSDNLTESECEVRIGEEKGVRMKRQRESGSEDGEGRNSDKRSKKEKRQSETEEELSSRVASKKSVMENIVKIGGKDKRRGSAGRTVESPDSDDDFKEDLRKKRESFLKMVVTKRGEKSHSMSGKSGKSPIKKASVNEKSNSSDSDSEDKRVNESSTGSNKLQNVTNLKTVTSSLKKTSNDEMMSQDMFEADSDDRNNEVENNSDSSESVKNNGDKSRNGDSDSDDRQGKTNSRSNSDERRRNSDSDSSSKIQEKSKVSNKCSISKQGDTAPKQVTKTSKNDGSKSKSPEKHLNPKKTDSLLNSSEILSNFEVNSQELFKTPSHKKKNATSTPFHSQAARQDLEQTMDMSAISNRLNNSSRADKSGSSSDSDEEGSTIITENNQSYTQTIIPKLWKRIEKKLSEGIKEEYFEEDVFYLEDLSDNDEVWVAPCPKSLDVSSLLGRKLNLTGRTDLKALQAKDGASNMDCEAWASPIEHNENVVYCLQASKNRKKMIINPLKLAGRVSIEEKIRMPSPHEVEFSTTMKLVMPENLKVRHPLLGAEFKNQPKTFNSDDVSSPRVKKKKKKKSKNLEHESDIIIQNPTSSINYTSTIEEKCDESMERKKNKKKKSRDNESAEGQADMSSYSHKSGDTSNLSEGEKKKRKKDKKRSREEADEEPSLQEDVPCEESSEHSSKKKKKKKRRLDE